MARRDITQFSEDANQNTDIDGINIAENCPIPNINNAIRALMGDLASMNLGNTKLTSLSVATIRADTVDLGNGITLQTDSSGLLINHNNSTIAKLTTSGDLRAVEITDVVNFDD